MATRLLQIPRRPPGALAPASASQRRLWLLHQVNPAGAGSNRPLALRLRGPLDLTRLGRSLTEIVRRHEVLRTKFVDVDGEPMQEVLPPSAFPLPISDLGALPEERRAEEARLIATREAQRPFDFAAGPPVRGLLLRLGATDHVLLLLMHHIVFDGWSEAVFVRELATLYGAFAVGDEHPLPELEVQYADFATWQRDRLRDGELDEQLRYWKTSLEPLPPPLDLPLDLRPPDGMPMLGAEVQFELGADLSGRVKSWSRKERVTPFMVLLSAFEATLGREAGQDRFLVGVPIAGRSRAETEPLLGCFMNVVVMRADLAQRRTFRELVQAARAQTLESYDRQELPFERLVEALRPKRDRHRWPLFDVMVNMRTMPRAGTVAAAGLEIEPFPFERSRVEGLSLSLEIQEGAAGFRCTLTYAAELFRPSSAQRLARRLLTLLDAALEAPDRAVAHLPLMAEPERRDLLRQWNHAFIADPDPAAVHELVAAHARRAPAAPAVVMRGRTLTYGELEAGANRLAQYLRSQGIGPETVMALCLDRSPQLVVALLGVFKAGAAGFLVEPGVAPERTRVMLDQAAAVLTVEALAGELPHAAPRVLALDTLAGAIGSMPAEAPAVQWGDDSLAGVCFVSGPTGAPQGVMVTHGALRNHLRWRLARCEWTAADRVLHSAPLGTEDALWQVLAPLVSGGSLLLAGTDDHLDPSRLVGLIRDLGPTAACFTSHMLGAILDDPAVRECHTLRGVIAGGDVLKPAEQDRFYSLLSADLHQDFGSAETAFAATSWKCRRDDESFTVPVGTPIANTRIFVLDERLEPVPVGIRGELYVGGVGLARGYLDRPGTTAAAFVPDPHGPPGARLYRTGAVVRYREDGALEHLGRRDRRTSIQGLRVEPSEVETVLRARGGIEDAAIAAGLRAFIVPADVRPGLPELRAWLRLRLPEPMVPSRFVVVTELPRTTRGRVDHDALPLEAVAEPESPYVAPRTPSELRLIVMWSSLLRRDEVGVDDDFFALDGDMLLAARLAGQVRTTFGVGLSVPDVLRAPTPARLAELIDARRAAVASPEVPTADPTTAEAVEEFVCPASFAQHRLWRLHQLDPQGCAHILVQAHHLKGTLDQRALEAAIQDLVDRHEALRTSFTTVDGTPMQVVRSRASVALPVEHDTGPDAARRAAEEASRPFDLARGPLLRASLLRLAPAEHVLVLAVHRIVCDDRSADVLWRELEQCYRTRLLGEAPRLAVLPVQYADYAVWQREWLAGGVPAEELGYWRERLGGAPDAAARSGRRARRSLTIGPAQADPVRALSRGQGATLFMTLLGAFGVVLSRFTGREDVVVGSPVGGRTRPELEGVIGPFAQTLPLRLDLSGSPTFREVLDRVRKEVLGAYAHQDVPFERLVEELLPGGTRPDPGAQVLFEVTSSQGRLKLPGLEVQPLSLDEAPVTFDLALVVHESYAGLRCECSYGAEAFDAETIGRLLRQYAALLQQVAEDPDRPVEP